MRELLRQTIKPLADGFADDLTELLLGRVERDIARVGESLAIALSAIASDLSNTESQDGDPDRRDHDPVPQVRRRARRGLQLKGPQGQPDADANNTDDENPRAAPAPREGRPQGQRPDRLVEQEPLERLLHLPAGTFPRTDRYTMPASAVARVLGVTAERIYQLDEQLKPKITPSKRGNRSFRAYDPALIDAYLERRRAEAKVKASSAPLVPRQRLAPTPVRSAAELENAREQRRERIGRVSAKTPPSGRPPELGMRASVPRPTPPAPSVDEDQDDEIERWSPSRIAAETTHAEATKKPGELPVPSSTWAFGGGPR